MTFVSPVWLLLGLAVAVPLVLHLLQRHQGPRMVFPALRYLKRAEREHATRIRLRQVLLLALRVLALLLLAAAAARPFIRGAGAGHEPTSVVIILDNSLSTSAVIGDRRVLDPLRDAALGTLAAAGPDDRFWLIRAGAPWEPALPGEAAAVAEAVRATEPSAGGADLGAELERAASILASEPAERAREIHLLSDLQRGALAHAAGAADRPPVVVLRPGAAPPPNRGVTAVEVGGGLPPRAGERSTVAAQVSGPAADSLTARLVLEGSVRAAATVAPGEAAVLAFPARAPGLVTGRVEIDADALTGDDRRHFVARVVPPPVVSLRDAPSFLAEAMGVLEEAGRVRLAAPAAADVVLASGGAGLEALRAGRAVVVFPPATPLELPAANQRLAAAGVPWRFAAPRAGEARVDAPPGELAAVLGDARLRQVYGLEPQAASPDSVLVRLRGGEPWIVAGEAAGGGRYILVATPLTPEGGTIPTSAAMLPLLDRLVGSWARPAEAAAELAPGDVVTVPPADSLVPPEGPALPTRAGGVHRLVRPGVYRVFRADELVAAYAVNPPAAESELTRAAPAAVERQLGGDGVVLAAADGWGDAIFRARLGHETTWPLVLVALALLALEMGIAATGRGRAPDVSSAGIAPAAGPR